MVATETFINATDDVRYADSGWHETFTDDVGRLYRYLRSEYGRCVSHVYVDTTDGDSVPVGWVFSKRVEFDDAGRYGFRGERTYVREVWVSVGEQDAAGDVWRYDVKRRKGTMPANASEEG